MIMDRSNQLPTRHRDTTPLTPGGEQLEESNFHRDNTSELMNTTFAVISIPVHPQTNIVIFLATVLAVVLVFYQNSNGFADFNDDFNTSNNDFKVELQYDLGDELTSFTKHATDTIDAAAYTSPVPFNLPLIGVGLAVNSKIIPNLCTATPALTIATIITNENENEIMFDSGSNGPHKYTTHKNTTFNSTGD